MPTSVSMTAGVSLTKQELLALGKRDRRPLRVPHLAMLHRHTDDRSVSAAFPPAAIREVVDSRADLLGGNPMTAMTMGSADYTASTATAVTLSVTCSTSAASTRDSDGDVPFGAASNSAS